MTTLGKVSGILNLGPFMKIFIGRQALEKLMFELADTTQKKSEFIQIKKLFPRHLSF